MAGSEQASLQADIRCITAELAAALEGQPDRRLDLPLSDPAARRLVELINVALGAAERAVSDLQQALGDSTEQLQTLVANLPGAVYRSAHDSAWTMQYFSSGIQALSGYPPEDFIGNAVRSYASLIHPEDRSLVANAIEAGIACRAPFVLEYRILHADGTVRWVREHGRGVFAADGAVQHLDGVIFDISDFKRVEEELDAYRDELEARVDARSADLVAAQRQLMQAEKLASIGQLSAGIAHEINTPVQFVGDNLYTLRDTFQTLLELLEAYRTAARKLPAEESAALRRAEEAADLDYLLEDTPKAIAQSLEGVQRVAKIVRAMKDFSHVGRDELSRIDINALIESTLTVCRNEYKYVADVPTEFGEIPAVECYATHISQMLLNLIVNAAHAVADTKRRGEIRITTARDGDFLEIRIADTGTGIPEEIRHRIFDPFFTTKEVGRGTGQGLHIVYQTVVDKHGGTIDFESEVGAGTTFRVRIPLTRPADRRVPSWSAAAGEKAT